MSVSPHPKVIGVNMEAIAIFKKQVRDDLSFVKSCWKQPPEDGCTAVLKGWTWSAMILG